MLVGIEPSLDAKKNEWVFHNQQSVRQWSGAGNLQKKMYYMLIDKKQLINGRTSPKFSKSGQKILGRLGYHVTYFMSSVDALEKFRATPDEFDLVITDQTMPKMTGIELTKELLNIRPDIPIILCTGYSKKVSMESIKGLGIRGVVTKPIDMIKYAKTIRMVLGEKKQSQV